MITLTASAEEALAKVLSDNNMPSAALRIWVENASCSHMTVQMALDVGPYEADDVLFAGGNWKVVVDGISVGYLQDAKVDWRSENGVEGFMLASCSGGKCEGCTGNCSCKSK